MLRTVNDLVDDAIKAWELDGSDVDLPAVATFARMAFLVGAVSEVKTSELHRIGLARGLCETLYFLRRKGLPFSATPSEMAKELDVTRATMTARVEALVAAAYVLRGNNPDDARQTIVRLSHRGVSMTNHLLRRQAAAQAELLGSLARDDRALLEAVLRRVIANCLARKSSGAQVADERARAR